MHSRRAFLLGLSLPLLRRSSLAASNLRITALEVFVVPVNARGDWTFVRLKTNLGLTGLGEASQGGAREEVQAALKECFELVRGRSPFDIKAYRQSGWSMAKSGGPPQRVAFAAIEHALWDLAGKAFGAPVYQLFGGKLRDAVQVYANINRATDDRSPRGFAANAARAASEGFEAVKAAPFDGYPPSNPAATDIRKAADLGVACVEAIREAIGPERDLMIDCHSLFDVPLAVETARRMEAQRLSWYEEPVAPTRIEELSHIRQSIPQRIAAGERLFGMAGFQALAASGASDVLMPDVKYGGGLMKAHRIAALAELHGREISPHNPSGPVAMAASVQLAAGLPNFEILEYAWGEVTRRGDLVSPPETFERGRIRVPDAPGLGIELNEKVVAKHV
ncbi:MAG: mandelate racemase/muconate lactonizing enzyme family protein [Bryobacteraceae bacterium]